MKKLTLILISCLLVTSGILFASKKKKKKFTRDNKHISLMTQLTLEALEEKEENDSEPESEIDNKTDNKAKEPKLGCQAQSAKQARIETAQQQLQKQWQQENDNPFYRSFQGDVQLAQIQSELVRPQEQTLSLAEKVHAMWLPKAYAIFESPMPEQRELYVKAHEGLAQRKFLVDHLLEEHKKLKAQELYIELFKITLPSHEYSQGIVRITDQAKDEVWRIYNYYAYVVNKQSDRDFLTKTVKHKVQAGLQRHFKTIRSRVAKLSYFKDKKEVEEKKKILQAWRLAAAKKRQLRYEATLNQRFAELEKEQVAWNAWYKTRLAANEQK